MCAIVDTNVAYEVFDPNPERPEAGRHFFNWLTSPRGQLVVGGDLLEELSGNSAFLTWFRTALTSARVRRVGNVDLAPRLDELARKTCKSNDTHVLALAAASGARLLYTNNRALMDDFREHGERKLRVSRLRGGSLIVGQRSAMHEDSLGLAPRISRDPREPGIENRAAVELPGRTANCLPYRFVRVVPVQQPPGFVRFDQ